MFADGVMFDGSSIAGWKAINESDMVLMPDTETAHMDPFYAQSTMAIFCDILDPMTGEGLQPRPAHDREESRSLCEVRRFRRHRLFRAGSRNSSSSTTCGGAPNVQHRIPGRLRRTADQFTRRIRDGQPGPPSAPKGGYFPVNPIDSAQDIRSEMLTVMAKWA
jgi:glutamine synthetase